MRLERRWLLAFTIVACGDSQPLLTSAGPITTFPGPAETTAEALTTSSGGQSPGPISDAWMTGSPTASTSGEATTTTSDGGLAPTSTTTGDPLADCPRLRVMVPAGEVLNVRPSPSTAEEPVATLGNGQLVETVAAVAGEA